MFGWFFEKEREREGRKFLWPRGLSSASRIEKRLSPRLSPSAFYSYSAAFTNAATSMATRWRSANFNDLFRGQAQPPEIRQSPPELLYSFLVAVVVVGREIRRLGKGGKGGKIFFSFLFETIFPFSSFSLTFSGQGGKNY